MTVSQTTVERLAWWVVFLVLVLNIAIFVKLTVDDNKKFKVLKNNQSALICIVTGFANRQTDASFINRCVKGNQ